MFLVSHFISALIMKAFYAVLLVCFNDNCRHNIQYVSHHKTTIYTVFTTWARISIGLIMNASLKKMFVSGL